VWYVNNKRQSAPISTPFVSLNSNIILMFTVLSAIGNNWHILDTSQLLINVTVDTVGKLLVNSHKNIRTRIIVPFEKHQYQILGPLTENKLAISRLGFINIKTKAG